MAQKAYALSIKQPWAALLVHGLKRIEVRSWPTARRGRVFIHAARVPDRRSEVWERVPVDLEDAARLTGGIVGCAEVVDCVAYRSAEAFAADRDGHLNDLTWFEPPVLYGFVFENAMPFPFQACSGWMRFFPVEQAQ